MARKRKTKRPRRASYRELMDAINELKSTSNRNLQRALDAEIKAALWDKIVEAVRDSVLPDIEEKVSDAVEDAVSRLTIS